MLTVNMNRPIFRNPLQVSKGINLDQYNIDSKPDPVFKPAKPINWQDEAMPDKAPPTFGEYDQYGNFVANNKIGRAKRAAMHRMKMNNQLVDLVNSNRRKF